MSTGRTIRETLLMESEADHILALPKQILEDIRWKEEEGQWYMEVPVEAPEDWPLRLYGRFNPRTGHCTFILFCGRQNLRRLDAGKRHHNPECDNTTPFHKHKWTDRFRDKWAYDVSPVSSISDAFHLFVEECNIQLHGSFKAPPSAYQRRLI